MERVYARVSQWEKELLISTDERAAWLEGAPWPQPDTLRFSHKIEDRCWLQSLRFGVSLPGSQLRWPLTRPCLPSSGMASPGLWPVMSTHWAFTVTFFAIFARGPHTGALSPRHDCRRPVQMQRTGKRLPGCVLQGAMGRRCPLPVGRVPLTWSKGFSRFSATIQ